MSLYETLKEKLQTVEIDGEILYVTEGDTLLDDLQLELYAGQREAEDAAFKAMLRAGEHGLGGSSLTGQSRLVGIVNNGKLVRWADGLKLSYRIAKDSFVGGDADAHYKVVKENMMFACNAWENTCGVQFEHCSDLDDKPGVGLEGCLFVVREVDAFGRFIAAAFFPTDPKNRRRVVIDPSYYTTSFDKVGVLRHELGHLLGFRHEHIRSGAPADCPDEGQDDTRDLTEYDPQSVMHYFCGGEGSRDLFITEIDREGSQRLYGLPLNEFRFVE